MGNEDDVTVNNLTYHLVSWSGIPEILENETIMLHIMTDLQKTKLEGCFRWNLLTELHKKVESIGNNRDELTSINSWLKSELEALVSRKNEEDESRREMVIAQSILDLIYMRSNFSHKNQDEIFIYTSPYVAEGVFPLQKGSGVNNKNTFTLDVCSNTKYYKCNNATPSLVDHSINSKILRFSNLFVDFCRSKNVKMELKPLRNNSDSEVTVYGMIGSEGESQIDQLNVTLQGSTTMDMGLKVQVQNLHTLDEFCLFPGQMAAVTGVFYEDNFGMKYMASDIRCGIPVEKPLVTLASQNKFRNENIHIVAFRGALLTETLEQTSFVDIFQKLKRDKPHLVFIVGPFVTVNQIPIEGHDLGRLGDLTFLYIKFLKDLSNLAQFGPLKTTKFVVVPHCYDLLLGYPLPQPPLNCKSTWIHEKSFPENVIFLSNPGYLRVNGILVGVTSCDPISGIRKNMVCKPEERSTKMICQQLLMQRSFFPSYPASKLPAEYAIDHGKLRELEFAQDMIPDVFVFCSAMKEEPFVEFTNQRAFISLHNSSKPPKKALMTSITEIYITPKKTDPESEGLLLDLDIENRITLSYTFLKEE